MKNIIVIGWNVGHGVNYNQSYEYSPVYQNWIGENEKGYPVALTQKDIEDIKNRLWDTQNYRYDIVNAIYEG